MHGHTNVKLSRLFAEHREDMCISFSVSGRPTVCWDKVKLKLSHSILL